MSENNDNFDVIDDLYSTEKKQDPKGNSLLLLLSNIWQNFWKDTARANKVILTLVIVVGFFSLFFAYGSFIKSTDVRSFATQQEPEEKLTVNDTSQPDLLGLRQKDTDNDGLSDYDELNIHFTSPYLEDSDSDGSKDKDEIAENSDPNCPKGYECSIFRAESDFELASRGVTEDQVYPQQMLEQVFGGYLDGSQQIDKELLSEQIKQLSVQQMRDLLIQQGFSQDILNEISDDDLSRLVEETLQAY